MLFILHTSSSTNFFATSNRIGCSAIRMPTTPESRRHGAAGSGLNSTPTADGLRMGANLCSKSFSIAAAAPVVCLCCRHEIKWHISSNNDGIARDKLVLSVCRTFVGFQNSSNRLHESSNRPQSVSFSKSMSLSDAIFYTTLHVEQFFNHQIGTITVCVVIAHQSLSSLFHKTLHYISRLSKLTHQFPCFVTRFSYSSPNNFLTTNCNMCAMLGIRL